MIRRGITVLTAVLTVLLSGCESMKKVAIIPPPPPQNYFSPAQGVAMRRVALLPACSEKYPGEFLRDVDAALNAELTKKSIFEVVPVTRPQLEALVGHRQISSVEALPAHLLEKLRATYAVDGVVLTDVTSYSPYRPVSIGLRAKLVDASNGAIRWAFDYIFDSGNPAVAEAAKIYQRQFNSDALPVPSDGGTALISPGRFAKYVANQTYASLKNEEVPPPQ